LVDPDGMKWVDVDGKKVTDHKNIKDYISYTPNQKDFAKQSMLMAKRLEKQYKKGFVAMSNVTTEAEFSQDWDDMATCKSTTFWQTWDFYRKREIGTKPHDFIRVGGCY
jgi:hypothetical protein